MGIFNWVQAKLSGSKQDQQRPNSASAFSHNSPTRKEEIDDDWPNQTLLAIGTFGNSKMEEDSSKQDASQNLPDFTSEEVIRIREELTKLMSTSRRLKIVESGEAAERMKEERDVSCPSSLLGAKGMKILEEDDDDDAKFQKIVLTRVKEYLSDNKNGSRKTSLKFLLKMFVCNSGFIPTPLRDPLPESRMEKVLRAMLHKKIYPQSSGQPATKKYLDKPLVRKYLEKTPTERLHLEGSKEEKSEEASKWVKTDSEYIVLEM